MQVLLPWLEAINEGFIQHPQPNMKIAARMQHFGRFDDKARLRFNSEEDQREHLWGQRRRT